MAPVSSTKGTSFAAGPPAAAKARPPRVNTAMNPLPCSATEVA
jgi:hypothetical protein